MSATNTFEDELLEHILNNADIALIGDATGLRGSSADGDLYISLHTADPGESGDQTTSEVAYTGYSRVAITRDGTGWTVTSGEATNDAAINFPKCTGSSATATHFGIGTASSSTGKLLLKGALSSSLAISNNIVPAIPAGDLSVTCE